MLVETRRNPSTIPCTVCQYIRIYIITVRTRVLNVKFGQIRVF